MKTQDVFTILTILFGVFVIIFLVAFTISKTTYGEEIANTFLGMAGFFFIATLIMGAITALIKFVLSKAEEIQRNQNNN